MLTISSARCSTESREDIVVSESSTLTNLQRVQRQVFTTNTYFRNPRRQVYFSQGYSEKENLSTTLMGSKIGEYSFNLYQIFLYQHGFLSKTIGVPAVFLLNRKKRINISHMKTGPLNGQQDSLLPFTYFL